MWASIDLALIQRKASIAVYPALGFSVLLILSWLAAVFYASLATLPSNNPFSTVWSYFTPAGSGLLLAVAIAGLLSSCLFPWRGPQLTGSSRQAAQAAGEQPIIWAVVATAGLGLLIAVKGDYLFYSTTYLHFVVPQSVVSIANLSAPVAVLAAGVMSTKFRVFGFLVFAALLLTLFAYGTRLEAATPAIFIVGRWLAGRKIGVRGWVTCAVSAFALLPIPLFSRSQATHGLFPYWNALVSHLDLAYRGGYLQLLGNIGFTAPIAEFTSRAAARIPQDAYWASLNPALGNSADWDFWAPYLRANYFIPFSSLGEFAQAGLPWLFLACLVWGLLTRAVISIIARDHSTFGGVAMIAAFGLISISALYCAQYNTRSVARIMWILVAMTLIVAARTLIERTLRAPIIGPHAGQERNAIHPTRGSKHPRLAPPRR